MTIEVLEPGALTSVQDATGRPAWRHLGVPAGGAADPWSARLANRLVGNAEAAPLLELTLIGPVLRFARGTLVALVGRFEATVDGLPMAPGAARVVRAGGILRIGAGEDARGYVAVAGGIAVEHVLGSAATDLRTGFGGFEGRALRSGDRLSLHPAARPTALRWAGRSAHGAIRVVPGPHADRLASDALVAPPWAVGVRADRTAARLEGPPVRLADQEEVPSMGLPAGAVQVPPDGLPIVALADRPVTGGYPVPAVVIGADIGRVARMRTGDELRFASVSPAEALQALRQAEADLDAVEPMDGSDDELRWIGSHE